MLLWIGAGEAGYTFFTRSTFFGPAQRPRVSLRRSSARCATGSAARREPEVIVCHARRARRRDRDCGIFVTGTGHRRRQDGRRARCCCALGRDCAPRGRDEAGRRGAAGGESLQRRTCERSSHAGNVDAPLARRQPVFVRAADRAGARGARGRRGSSTSTSSRPRIRGSPRGRTRSSSRAPAARSSPLTRRTDMLDIPSRLGIPVLLVVGIRLGLPQSRAAVGARRSTRADSTLAGLGRQQDRSGDARGRRQRRRARRAFCPRRSSPTSRGTRAGAPIAARRDGPAAATRLRRPASVVALRLPARSRSVLTSRAFCANPALRRRERRVRPGPGNAAPSRPTAQRDRRGPRVSSPRSRLRMRAEAARRGLLRHRGSAGAGQDFETNKGLRTVQDAIEGRIVRYASKVEPTCPGS